MIAGLLFVQFRKRELAVAIAIASTELFFKCGHVPAFRVAYEFLQVEEAVFVFIHSFELGRGVGLFWFGSGCMIRILIGVRGRIDGPGFREKLVKFLSKFRNFFGVLLGDLVSFSDIFL